MNINEARIVVAKRLKKMLKYGVSTLDNPSFIRAVETLVDLTLNESEEDLDE